MSFHQRMIVDPAHFAVAHYDEADGLTRAEIESIQLSCMQRRFAELRRRVPVLDRIAQEHEVDTLERLEDAARLLLPHTIFKSYPIHWVEEAQFDRLTSWLGALTSVDLSQVQCAGIETLDDWIDELDRHSQLRVMHTFGTSGKLSFIPRTERDRWLATRITATCMRDWYGRDSSPDPMTSRLPFIHPSYRFGAGAVQRASAAAIEHFAGGEHNALFLYPEGRFSADVASLAGRLRAADLRGEADGIAISPRLRARCEDFARRERHRDRDLRHFLEEITRRFAGRDVYLLGVWPVLFDWAQAGLKSGLRGVFGPGSILHTGGGMKGRELPANWREQIYEFLGVKRHFEFYAMSELIGTSPRCPAGNYHVPLVLVPFLFDAKSGDLLPRAGRARGRFGAFDLLAETSWGGVISGDEVTLAGWDEPCACGRPGTYVEPDIRRYSVAEGGADKISCAGSADAYERAVEFLITNADATA